MTDTDPNDVRDDPLSSTTRRGALAALGLGGLAALGSGSASADIGGGPASDAMSDHRVPFYRVPESELDSPGVVGRRVEITSGGAQYETGDQLVDTGSAWTLVDPGYGSVNAGSANIDGKPWHDVTTYGAVGDGSTDDSGAIQDAIDEASTGGGVGVVYFPTPDTSYLIDNEVIVKSNTALISPEPWTGAKLDAGPNLSSSEAVLRNTSGFENIYIYGLEVDGSDGWEGEPYFPSEKCFFFSPGATNDGTKNFVLEYCYAHDSPATAIGCDSIINQHYRNNIVENAGTDGETTGGNGLGIGLGEVSGLCPTWICGNHVIDTAEFAIILEQTKDTAVAEGIHVGFNFVDDARYGIGVEQCKGPSVLHNWVKASSRMEYGFIFDELDSNFGVDGATVAGAHILPGPSGEAPNTTFEFGQGASTSSLESYSMPTGLQFNQPVNNGSFCSIDGIGKEAAGSGNTPTWENRWERLTVSQVRNTDDSTVWVPDQTGGWDQIV